MTLLLVRHGESTWNATGLLQGRTSHVGLTARGREQARAAARALTGHAPEVVWSSPQRRALQTAQIVGQAVGAAVRTAPELVEQAHGVWEGRPAARYAELLARAAEGWAPPGGESRLAVRDRVAGFLRRAAAPGPMVVVTHGETIRALLAVLTGVEPAGLPANGQVLAVDLPTVTTATGPAA